MIMATSPTQDGLRGPQAPLRVLGRISAATRASGRGKIVPYHLAPMVAWFQLGLNEHQVLADPNNAKAEGPAAARPGR